jgi:hypothetical protein
MARKTSQLQKGDLEFVTITEHIDSPKKYAIMGKFKGSRKEIILARVGEGDDDPRAPETIKMTAEGVAKEIVSLYGLNAFLRRNESSASLAREPSPIRTAATFDTFLPTDEEAS